MKSFAAAAIIAQASVSLFATAAPLKVDLIGRELPTPVSTTTAKTYLAACKQSLIFYSTPTPYRVSCLLALIFCKAPVCSSIRRRDGLQHRANLPDMQGLSGTDVSHCFQ